MKWLIRLIMRILYIPRRTTLLTTTYGKLYNGYAVRDARNITASGWHIPTSVEFTTLVDYLGGALIAGQHLKETGTTHWSTPNAYADNTSGFTALGTGYRTDITGAFNNFNAETRYWASNNIYATTDYIMQLLYGDAKATVSGTERRTGLSVRAIRDNATGYTEGDLYTGNDGKTYPTKTIGTQIWILQNLKETQYRNGDSIPQETDNTTWGGLTTGAWCYYNNDSSNQ